jgi:hypothetical protein
MFLFHCFVFLSDEIIRYRQLKPQMGERLDAEWIPDETPIFKKLGGTAGGLELEKPEDKESQEEQKNDIEDEESTSSTPKELETEKSEEEREGADQEKADDDSTEAAGKQEAAEQDRDMMNGDDDSSPQEENPAEGYSAASSMLAKILNLGAPSMPSRGQVVLNEGATQPVSSPKNAPAPSGPSARLPSLVHNGRMVCNLPDHAIHAGCTAIVAVITGRTLTVANAGDSRAVLCRGGGETYALSYDHKPQQERESNRIIKAGGFVNEFGRVNGNLNLSRSLGDLKYKQVPGIPPPEQIITAEPDIMQ